LTARTLWAERGQGAWVRTPQGDARLTVPTISADLKGLSGAIYNRDLGPAKGILGRFVRHGSAAHDYWAPADGRMHVLAYRRLKPWDHAAGVLIHAEAGGYNRLLSGAAYDPTAPEQIGLLCAPNPEIWSRIKALAESA